MAATPAGWRWWRGARPAGAAAPGSTATSSKTPAEGQGEGERGALLADQPLQVEMRAQRAVLDVGDRGLERVRPLRGDGDVAGVDELAVALGELLLAALDAHPLVAPARGLDEAARRAHLGVAEVGGARRLRRAQRAARRHRLEHDAVAVRGPRLEDEGDL